MAAEFPHLIQASIYTFPWMAIIFLVIRSLPDIILTCTHLITIMVALFHRTPRRRQDARKILDQHPFTRRR